MRILGTLVFFAASLFAGANTASAQQQKADPSVSGNVNAEEEVWQIDAAHADAREVVLSLGRELRRSGLDCSHLVHEIYERAGLSYDYAPSRDLYDGVDGFRRVYHPLPGDIVVWRGHVGIVLDPDAHSFLSALRSGVKVADYQTNYWKHRGHPRFYRYALKGQQELDWSRVLVATRISSESE